jgi:hypothetical protein
VAKLKSLVRAHARKTIFFLRRTAALWESRLFGLTILGSVGVPVVALIEWPYEHIVRYPGLGLQLAGIGTVWWGIRETRKLFEHPSFWTQAGAWFHRRPRYGGRVVGLAGSGAAAATASARLSVWRGARRDATLEQRIEALEHNLIQVRDDAIWFQNKTENDIRRQDQAIKEEQQTRDSADQEIRQKLKAAETGGLHISAMGAMWLLVGVTMSTIPAELARCFG